jgi:hypothetical protein
MLVCASLLIYCSLESQTFSVKGSVTANSTPVKHASVTFIDQNDTSRMFSALTDGIGNYKLSVVTSVFNQTPLVPQSVELAQNYPNPFSGSTAISYKLNKHLNVNITIFDILGREVKTFAINSEGVGIHGILWDGKNNLGDKVATGIYFYQLNAADELQVKKMVYVGGVVNASIPSLQRFSYLVRQLAKEENVQIRSGTFTVQIVNTDSTMPRIFRTQFPNLVLRQDTTLNFQVQEGITAISLCYLRVDSFLTLDSKWFLQWKLHLNNITGTNDKRITNWGYYFEERDAAWSPDGKYIGFTRVDDRTLAGDRDLFLYNTENDSLIGLVVSDTMDTAMKLWTPDGRLIYTNRNKHESVYSTYIIDVDGSNNRRLEYRVNYIYPDSYNTLYLLTTSSKGALVYHSNLDGTVNEFIVDLTTFVSTSTGGVTIFDFDLNANELLLSFDDPSTTLPNFIANYNVTLKHLDTVAVSAPGWKCYRPKFSNDFEEIAIAEVHIADSVNLTNRISILENAAKTTLVEFVHKDEEGKTQFIDYRPFAFSPDNTYLAFSKNVVQPGAMVWWISYLYVVELETKQKTFIDYGILPLWNPNKPH